MKLSMLAFVLPLLTACAPHTPPQPHSVVADTCSAKILDRLYFGADSPQGPVSDADWQAFLREVVTPLFPEGLTVIDAHGQWLGNDKRIVRESSRIVELLHDDTERAHRSVSAIAREYRERFHQEAVLLVTTPVRACF